MIKAKPTLLLFKGELQSNALRRTRVTAEEVRAALRNQGVGSMEEAGAVVLETDGSFSVISQLSPGGLSTLVDVEGFKEEPNE